MKRLVSMKRELFYYFNKVILNKLVNIDLISIDETIEYIIQNKCSVARFGDGELALINLRGIGFQDADVNLSNRLKKILKNDVEGIAICVPGPLKYTKELSEDAKLFWEDNLKTGRFSWYRNMNLKKRYYNAHMTRLYMDFNDKSKSEELFKQIIKIWEYKDITIIEGSESNLGIGNDLFDNARSIERIIAPSKNAFEKYNEILESAKKVDKDRLILIALGPTATVLAYDLHLLGYQAIDIGHIDIEYEWFKRKCSKKEHIEGKYTNEVSS